MNTNSVKEIQNFTNCYHFSTLFNALPTQDLTIKAQQPLLLLFVTILHVILLFIHKLPNCGLKYMYVHSLLGKQEPVAIMGQSLEKRFP